MARFTEEYIPKSQRFTPVDEKGGTLTWKVRVTRQGFRPKVEERSMRKDYHTVEINLDPVLGSAYGDALAGEK